ncbi:hypothetical protein ACFP3U_12720 [Kitasatospora misakiensis]|uniref:Thioesterase domain-containing protein n=1 Tax=Kitasatospora misakiensis TaxID=67330 RepID=A0ABW0X230_9ACTN
MTAGNAWKSLTGGGNSRGILLAVDFDTTGRPEARFADLLANLGPEFAAWETVPPAADAEAARSGAGYLDHWTRGLADLTGHSGTDGVTGGLTGTDGERPAVHAVLGFCGGAIYAAALAERIAEQQDEAPLLVLFDPELSTAQTLIWQFHKVIGFLSAVISEEQIAEAREMGQQAFDEIPDVMALKDELLRLMREFGEPALIAAGLDETRREELFAVFESFLCYLAAASQIDPLPRWRSAVSYSSTSPLSGLNAMRSAGLEIEVGEEIRIDTDHGVMLADKELASAVARLLDR